MPTPNLSKIPSHCSVKTAWENEINNKHSSSCYKEDPVEPFRTEIIINEEEEDFTEEEMLKNNRISQINNNHINKSIFIKIDVHENKKTEDLNKNIEEEINTLNMPLKLDDDVDEAEEALDEDVTLANDKNDQINNDNIDKSMSVPTDIHENQKRGDLNKNNEEKSSTLNKLEELNEVVDEGRTSKVVDEAEESFIEDEILENNKLDQTNDDNIDKPVSVQIDIQENQQSNDLNKKIEEKISTLSPSQNKRYGDTSFDSDLEK